MEEGEQPRKQENKDFASDERNGSRGEEERMEISVTKKSEETTESGRRRRGRIWPTEGHDKKEGKRGSEGKRKVVEIRT